MEIKKCPFCGEEAVVYSIKNLVEDDFEYVFGVRCSNAHCMVRTDLHYSANEAKAEWNELYLDGEILH